MNPPAWYWYATDILKAITPLLVGVAVGYIAWQQWRTAHQQAETAKRKLRFDLFDRRFKVFMATKRLVLSSAANPSKRADLNDMIEFEQTTAEAEFLFAPELVAYLERLRNWTEYVKKVSDYLDSAPALMDEEKYKNLTREEKRLLAVVKVAEGELNRYFRPYLDLQTAK
ncbi:MAG TPA: hypothetical protein VGR35_00330 [Tepidisphaeraceae bacterium]|nr:hypothetical protein [Tepidisphaeraceae bacterium]